MTMPEWLITLAVKGWLVLAVAFFLMVGFQTFRPSARAEMERRARIPFAADEQEEFDGRA